MLIDLLPKEWADILNKNDLQNLAEIDKKLNKITNSVATYPPKNLIFNAFKQTSFDSVKVVILGQDPYHNENEAMGLAFSVPNGVKIPPSLKNIFKEINSDLNITPPLNGDLTRWANEGVLLLNSVLTVSKNAPSSHAKIGWQSFSDKIIYELAKRKSGLVFMLWGNYARAKKQTVLKASSDILSGDGVAASRHLILEAAHPSPLSAKGFLGCRHFSKCNAFLSSNNTSQIRW